MTPEEAASIIGVSPNLIRLWLQQDKYDFGTYDKKVGAQAGSYTIFRHKFEKFVKNYCGIDIKKDTLADQSNRVSNVEPLY